MAPARGGALAACLITIVASLAACAPASEADLQSERSQKADVPHFSGPYADDFRQAYTHTESDNVRGVLADGIITAQEFAEVRSAINSCVADSGYYVKWNTHGGGFSVGAKDEKYPDDFHKKSDPILRTCENKFDGDITFLYQETNLNPDKVNLAGPIAKCLVKKGLAKKGYSARDYDRDSLADKLPFDEFDPQAQACQFDPLGKQPEGL